MNDGQSYQDLTIFGAGGHGRVIADSAKRAGFKCIIFVDENPAAKPEVQGLVVLQSSGIPAKGWSDRPFIVAIGANGLRARIFDRLTALGAKPVSVVDPGSQVSGLARIGAGSYIAPGAIVNTGAQIGANCIVNTAASVDHDCVLGDHSQVSPHACLTGNVHLGPEVMLGAGAIVVPGCTVGPHSVIGAGSVVTRDIPAGVCAWGAPARVIASPR